jgi:hypothetical protein
MSLADFKSASRDWAVVSVVEVDFDICSNVMSFATSRSQLSHFEDCSLDSLLDIMKR